MLPAEALPAEVTGRVDGARGSSAVDRNLALDLVRVTEAAALAAGRWVGRGDKESGDGAAVEAMRLILGTIDVDGVVVIGEGAKDEAPMLADGERVGTGVGPAVDVAVAPVEGTALLAYGRPDAIAVIGLAPRGTMWSPGPAYYMEKLGCGPPGRACCCAPTATWRAPCSPPRPIRGWTR